MNYNNHYATMAEGFMSKVYSWMAAGLAVTAAVAYYLSPAVNPAAFQALVGFMFPLMLVQFGLVMFFSFSWKSLQYETLAMLFIVYSGLMGVTLAPLAYVYTGESIFQVFVIAAAMFGVMAVYGAMTRTDLSSISNILFMGLIGLMIANLINMFWKNAQFDMVTSCIGVALFAILVACDVQMLRNFGSQAMASEEDSNKVALLGALTLYLDVVNLFIYLIRLLGKKRND